jgi:hypothetical protein
LGKFPQLFCLSRRHVGYTNFGTFEFANSRSCTPSLRIIRSAPKLAKKPPIHLSCPLSRRSLSRSHVSGTPSAPYGKLITPHLPKINYHPQSGWFEDAPLKGGAVIAGPLRGHCCRKPSSEGTVIACPRRGRCDRRPSSEGTVAGGPLRGLRAYLDPPHEWTCLTSVV